MLWDDQSRPPQLAASSSSPSSSSDKTACWAFNVGWAPPTKAFMQIPNASLRRSIVNLVEQIAGPED